MALFQGFQPFGSGIQGQNFGGDVRSLTRGVRPFSFGGGGGQPSQARPTGGSLGGNQPFQTRPQGGPLIGGGPSLAPPQGMSPLAGQSTQGFSGFNSSDGLQQLLSQLFSQSSINRGIAPAGGGFQGGFGGGQNIDLGQLIMSLLQSSLGGGFQGNFEGQSSINRGINPAGAF